MCDLATKNPNLGGDAFQTMPFLSRLEGAKIQPGQTIKIQGVQTGDMFEIDLVAGPDVQRSDMPFILAVFKKDKKLSLNDRHDGKLGKEISKKDPFKKDNNHGNVVDLRIRVGNDRFQIFANMKNFGEFEYRQPLISVTHLHVVGDLELKNVSWGGKHYPVPYQAHVEGNLRVGKQLIVTGLPEKKADKISIDLLNNKNDIIFHCQIRFSQKNVVFNSRFDEVFGAEEVVSKLPAKVDNLFDLLVVCEPQTFQVYFDNEHFHTFTHRADPETINRLSIQHDVELLGVYVK